MTQPTTTEIVDLLICGPYSTLGIRKFFEIGSGDAARTLSKQLAGMQRDGEIRFDHASRRWVHRSFDEPVR